MTTARYILVAYNPCYQVLDGNQYSSKCEALDAVSDYIGHEDCDLESVIDTDPRTHKAIYHDVTGERLADPTTMHCNAFDVVVNGDVDDLRIFELV